VSEDTFADMHADLFDELGQDGTVSRGVTAPVPVRVIIERGVQLLGEYGQVVETVDRASFLVAQWRPAQNDVLSVTGATRKVQRLLSDNGYVAKAVLHV
jgi:hypothetical protein